MTFIRKKRVNGKVYLYVVSNTRKGNRIIQDSAYLGREVDLPNILAISAKTKHLLDADLENLLYQTPVSLWNLMEQMKFRQIFTSHFSKEWGVDAATAASVMIINYATERQTKVKFGDWYAHTYLPHLLGIPADKMNKDLLCRTMDFFTEEKIEKIHTEIFKTAASIYQLKEETLFYDITAVTFEGENCPLAERGYNSKGSYNLQVNLGLAITEEKFPVMHKVFEGNIKDVKTFGAIVSAVEKLGRIKNTIFIFDRGISSENNFEQLEQKGAKYIAGMPKNGTVKKLIRNINETDFTKINDEICYHETTYNGRRLVVFWNKKLQEENRQFREKKLEKISAKLSKLAQTASRYPIERLHEKVGEICGNSRKIFNIKFEPVFSFNMNQKEIEKQASVEGKYAILTNTDIPAEEILRRYRDRNFVEMSFKDLKLFVDIRPVRHWKENRVLAHIFLAVLAFGLRSILELKLRRKGIQITSQEAITKLNQVRALVCKNKVLRLTGETEEIKTIVSAIES